MQHHDGADGRADGHACRKYQLSLMYGYHLLPRFCILVPDPSCFLHWVFPHSPLTRNYHHPPTHPTQSSLQLEHSLPIGPGPSPPLTSLKLSQETLRLPIITFPAETVAGWKQELAIIGATHSRYGYEARPPRV